MEADDRVDAVPVRDESELPRALVGDIAARLRGPCAHLPPETFDALVAAIAESKVRFARRESGLPGLSGVWDPPDLLPPDSSPSDAAPSR